MKRGDLIKVTWIDAGTINEWLSPEELEVRLEKDDNDTAYTVGYFFRENKDFISLTQSVIYNGEELKLLTETMTIPKKMVIKVEHLK